MVFRAAPASQTRRGQPISTARPNGAVASTDVCRRVAFPPERRLVIDTLRLGRNKAMMHGLLEVDVTRARQLLREHREQTGEGFSFTAFVLACLGRAVAAHPEVHALPDWLGRSVLFEDVDVTTIVEVDVDGRPFGLAHVLRAVNRRTPRELHDEIRGVQVNGARSVSPGLRLAAKIFLLLPGMLRRLVFRSLLRFPRLAKRHTGTVLLTAVGMFGGGPGWGFSAPGIHNLSIVVGGLARRCGAEGQSGAREILGLTVSANHELIDGAPLARFVHDLRTHLEAADGLAGLTAS
jgi:pyruvate/2-oxoglutarate dehydrogenase complex dihydrolipoamide acyltransferase (E2) component